MANGNPFFISPAASQGAMQGLGAIGSAFIQKQQQDQAQAAQQAAQQEIQGALQSGDVGQIQQVMLKYPQMAQTIEQSFGFSSEQSKQDMINRAFNILSGGSGVEVLGERAEQLEANGRDATQTREGMAMEPEELRQVALATIGTLGSAEQIKFAQSLMPQQPDIKVGRYRYLETPDGFLRADTATGEQTEIKLGSKEAERAEEERRKAAEEELEAEQTTFSRAEKLRGEYGKRSKEYFAVRDAYDRIAASVEDPDAAGDIALIFNYMKMLDPGSVVREGEFATAQNAGSVAQSVYNLYNRVLSGERLAKGQRDMFSKRAEKLFDKAQTQNTKDRDQILNLGRRYNVTEQDIFGQPEQVTTDTGQTTQAQQAPPEAVQFLKQNPQLAEQFRQKYGYLPNQQELAGGTLPEYIDLQSFQQPGAF